VDAVVSACIAAVVGVAVAAEATWVVLRVPTVVNQIVPQNPLE
jgi:hypothetical protein